MVFTFFTFLRGFFKSSVFNSFKNAIFIFSKCGNWKSSFFSKPDIWVLHVSLAAKITTSFYHEGGHNWKWRQQCSYEPPHTFPAGSTNVLSTQTSINLPEMCHTLHLVLTHHWSNSESQHLICPVDVNRTPLLKLNVQKTQFSIFSNRNLTYWIPKSQILYNHSCQSINVLGVALDSDLSFHTPCYWCCN